MSKVIRIVYDGTQAAAIVAAGMSDTKRRQKANSQPRDSQGRWISAGANVRWRADGKDWSGTVDKVENGKAFVTVRHSDGSTSQTTLMPSTLKVMASKARLGSAAKKYHDWQNKSDRYIGEHAPELEEAASSEEGAVIQREDGYAIEMKRRKDQEGNPLIYQLYGPGGQSLGIYDKNVVGDIDGMISDHKGGGAGEAPAAPAAPAGGGVTASGYERPYSVPQSVRETVEAALATSPELPEDELKMAQALCSGEQVGLDEIQWVHEFFETLKEIEAVFGGYQGRKWASKIMDKVEADEPSVYAGVQHDFNSEAFEYFAVSTDMEGTAFTSLIGVDFADDKVYVFDGVTFSGPISSATDFDAEYIEPLDSGTAMTLADMINSDSVEGQQVSFSTLDAFPEERNLFALAESAMDFDFLNTIAQLSNEDYKKQVNAQGQARGEGGKFGQVSGPPAQAVAPDKPAVEDPAQAVEDASDQAAGADDPMAVAKYFAIVDEVDQTAVLDVVAVTQVNGAPSAFKRTMGGWVVDPETLAALQGATPPSVVALDTVDEVKDVLSQVDSYDNGEDAVTASAAQRGYALADGSHRILTVDELIDSVNSATQLSDVSKDVLDHIVKRARALNRMDVVPEDWRVLSNLRGPRDLVGEFGEVIVAAGVPGIADTASDHEAVQRLKNYWKYGPGAAKIRWGTDGDLTRAFKNLVKYVGPDNAWGLAQNLHMELFGKSNYKKDNG